MDLKLSIAQLKPYIGNPGKNLHKIIDAVEKVANEESDLIIFPELFLVGYLSKDLIYRLAEPRNGEHVRALLKLSREYDLFIITGFAEKDEDYSILYNSALMATPDGDLKIYRKMHLPDFSVFDEARYFRRWDGELELWEIRGVKTGVMICYDIFFPEIARAYTYMGAKVLIGISATPDFSRPLFHILVQARAIENTTYFIWVNTVGAFDGIGFAGGSRVVAPLGKILYDSPLIEEDLKTIKIDINEVDIAREKRPILKDIFYADVNVLVKGYKLNKSRH